MATQMIVRAGRFSLDGGPSYAGYTTGQRWNGWAMPYFTRETADAIAAPWNANPDDGMSAVYDAASDTYTFADPLNDMEPEVVQGMDVWCEGEQVHVYPVGSGMWVWEEEVETVTAVALALRTMDAETPLVFHEVGGQSLTQFRFGTNAAKTHLNFKVVAYSRNGEHEVCSPDTTFTIYQE